MAITETMLTRPFVVATPYDGEPDAGDGAEQQAGPVGAAAAEGQEERRAGETDDLADDEDADHQSRQRS